VTKRKMATNIATGLTETTFRPFSAGGGYREGGKSASSRGPVNGDDPFMLMTPVTLVHAKRRSCTGIGHFAPRDARAAPRIMR
jgi:hypothetical protein